MWVTDSKELSQNEAGSNHTQANNDTSGNKISKRNYEEEEKYGAKTQSSNEGAEELKDSQYGTPQKYSSSRKQVFSDMTRRVLKNKESFSSSKASTHYSSGFGKLHQGRNIDPDGIEWVKKDEIIDNRLISSRPYGTKKPKEKRFGPGSNKNTFIKARSGVLTFLPPKALATILSYDMGSYRKYMSVCASWHVTIKEAFDQHFNRVENEFVLKYHQNVLFTESYTSSSAIKF
mmetsp:Transcript_2063/g.1868  ORF Transcript_2063/g.1868 Transcript_2063/m.1868 type:complete len:232 (+) Transcript_2063:8-703(+)